MILKRISILNYKNLEQVEIGFSAKLNCFFGQNGMGKTNLLDAVYFLSFCKSSGNPIDSQNIRHEQDFFVIQGFYEAEDGTPEEIYCGMKRRSKKQFKRNKKGYSRFSDHIGFLPLVMVSPADSELIAGGSDERRRFMDVVISQYDKEYLEDIDMNQSEFFQHLEQNPGCRVSTSQPTPESVTTLWGKLLKDYDEIVHIPMSSGLSSSMQTARMLAEDYDGRVRVVNNQRISGTLRYSAIEAIQQAKNGLSADEIGTWLEKTRFDSSIYITVATLKYLKQGGRITPAAAALGTMLRLKPVLQIQGEKLDAFSKARTMTQAKSTMTKAIKDDIADRFGEKINLDVIHSHNLEAAEEFRKEVLTTFPNIGEVNIFPLSLSVSCHIGPGSLALTCSKVHPEIW